MTEENLFIIVIFGGVPIAFICLILSLAAFLQARKARDINFERAEQVTKFVERVTTLDMKISNMELKLAQQQQIEDVNYLKEAQGLSKYISGEVLD